MSKLPESEDISSKDRTLILSTLGYFLLSRDILSEEIFGPIGLIDDIYICLYCLNYIKNKYSFDILMEYWEHDYESLNNYLTETYNNMLKDEKYKKIFKDTSTSLIFSYSDNIYYV